MLPSLAVRLDDGTPIAWAFLGESMCVCLHSMVFLALTPIPLAVPGLDGTIITLHVEVSSLVGQTQFLSTSLTRETQEPYRRRGLAKALACKLMREHLGDYGDDGWGAADVFELNHKSQALCKSIGGKLSWTVSWLEWARPDIIGTLADWFQGNDRHVHCRRSHVRDMVGYKRRLEPQPYFFQIYFRLAELSMTIGRQHIHGTEPPLPPC